MKYRCRRTLTEYSQRTRGDFRNAQLQAKRNAEIARRKERELLFSRSEDVERPSPAKEKLTQEDIVKNASKDVTTALRRTHQLMQAELSRSQFAQETLGKSNSCFHDTFLTSRRAIRRRVILSVRILYQSRHTPLILTQPRGITT